MAHNELMLKEGTISPEDMKLFIFTDDVEKQWHTSATIPSTNSTSSPNGPSVPSSGCLKSY